MAGKAGARIPGSVFVDRSSPAETLRNVAAVLGVLSELNDVDVEASSEDAPWGRSLIALGARDALLYEAERLRSAK